MYVILGESIIEDAVKVTVCLFLLLMIGIHHITVMFAMSSVIGISLNPVNQYAQNKQQRQANIKSP